MLKGINVSMGMLPSEWLYSPRFRKELNLDEYVDSRYGNINPELGYHTLIIQIYEIMAHIIFGTGVLSSEKFEIQSI